MFCWVINTDIPVQIAPKPDTPNNVKKVNLRTREKRCNSSANALEDNAVIMTKNNMSFIYK